MQIHSILLTLLRSAACRRALFVCCFLFLSVGRLSAQVYILDEQFNAAPGLPPGFSGAGVFSSSSGIGNYGRNAPALRLTNTGQWMSYGPWVGNADHVSFFHRGSAGTASTLLTEESVDGVTWTTAGTCTFITTSATWDAPLLPTSRYIRFTFTLVGTNQPYIDDLRIRAETALCIAPPKIMQILINGGCSACEDSNEFVYFNTGGQPLDIRYFELVNPFVIAAGAAYGGNGTGNNLNTNWVLSAAYSAAQLSYISNLNLWSTCTNVFVPVPASNIIPANAPVIAITGSAPDAIYNLSGLCSLGTVYVIFSTRNNCPTSSGKYGNNSCSSNCSRFITIFNHQTGCLDNEQYYVNSSTTSDGDMYIFAGGPVGYTFNVPCAAVVLPVQLIEFAGQEKDGEVELSWTTFEEIDVEFYELQRSTSGLDFTSIHRITATGISSLQQYGSIDSSPVRGVNYYRLAIHDENGDIEFSDMIAVNVSSSDKLFDIVKVDDRFRVVSFANMNDVAISCYNLDGKLIASINTNLAMNETKWIDVPAGDYSMILFSISTSEGQWTSKFQMK